MFLSSLPITILTIYYQWLGGSMKQTPIPSLKFSILVELSHPVNLVSLWAWANCYSQ